MSRDIQGHLVIAEALTRLVVGRGGTLDDVQAEIYLHDLVRFDPQVVARACDRWRTVPRKDFEPALPEVGRLIQTIERITQEDVDAARAAKCLPMPAARTDEPTFVCRDCWDGYWREFFCQGAGELRSRERHPRHDGIPVSGCGRTQRHAPHRFVERCACIETNPVIQRQLQRQRTRVAGSAA